MKRAPAVWLAVLLCGFCFVLSLVIGFPWAKEFGGPLSPGIFVLVALGIGLLLKPWQI